VTSNNMNRSKLQDLITPSCVQQVDIAIIGKSYVTKIEFGSRGMPHGGTQVMGGGGKTFRCLRLNYRVLAVFQFRAVTVGGRRAGQNEND